MGSHLAASSSGTQGEKTLSTHLNLGTPEPTQPEVLVESPVFQVIAQDVFAIILMYKNLSSERALRGMKWWDLAEKIGTNKVEVLY